MNAALRTTLAVAVLALALPAAAALKPGERAPDFRAQAYLAGKPFTFDLAKARRSGPVIVYFFPAAHTPGCNLEAHLFSEAIDDFRKAGATVVGLSAGNTEQLAKSYDALLGGRADRSDRTSYVVTKDGRIAAVHSDLNPSLHVKSMLDAVKALGLRPAK